MMTPIVIDDEWLRARLDATAAVSGVILDGHDGDALAGHVR